MQNIGKIRVCHTAFAVENLFLPSYLNFMPQRRREVMSNVNKLKALPLLKNTNCMLLLLLFIKTPVFIFCIELWHRTAKGLGYFPPCSLCDAAHCDILVTSCLALASVQVFPLYFIDMFCWRRWGQMFLSVPHRLAASCFLWPRLITYTLRCGTVCFSRKAILENEQ